jgi:hypothetical protein
MELREAHDPRSEYYRRLASAEHDYLFGNNAESKASAQEFETLQAMRESVFVSGEAEPIEEFYEAARDVEVLTTSYYGLDKYLLDQTAKAGKKPAEMSDNEIAALSAKYGSIDEIKTIEDDAIELLEKSGSKKWDRPRINNSYEAELLGNNIKYLQALRIIDGKERSNELDKLLGEQRALIDSLSDAGKKGEWMLIHLISKWAKETGHANLIKIMHSDPRSDLKYKNDATIWLGFRSASLQIETANEERSDESLAQSFQKKTDAVHSTTSVAQIPSGALRRLYQGEGAGRADKNMVVNVLGGYLKLTGAGDILPLLYNAPRSEADKKTTRLGLIKKLPKIIDVAMLISLGLITESDRADVSKVLSAKNQAINAVATEIKEKRIDADEDLKNPATTERLKQLFK